MENIKNYDINKTLIETQYFTLDEDFILETGYILKNVKVAFETYGVLNETRTNAILIEHTFTGDSHAFGYKEGDKKPGWWDNLIGYGKAVDLDKFFVICSNVLGGCQGTTGPSSINPETNKYYAMDFPFITIKDMVNLQKKLIDFLKIRKLVSIIGGSMGGMQVLEWVASYPDYLKSAIPIATTMKHSSQQIAFNEVARQAIIMDPDWNNGNYYDIKKPEIGLGIARMIGHITYMSHDYMEKKFSRRKISNKQSFETNFEVESYLKYQRDNFVKRFDANSYIYITKAMDYFDVSSRLFAGNIKSDIKFMVIAFESDWLYPVYQSLELIKLLRLKQISVTYCNIQSNYGHDAFLIDADEVTKLIKPFLDSIKIDED